MRGVLAVAALLLGSPVVASDDSRVGTNNYAAEHGAITLAPAQTRFVLRCGGCHGTLGLSPPKSVPVLRGTAGYFLCTPEAREYAVRVPNVARALLTDQELSDVLNFVTFELGETSAPRNATRFSAAEIHEIRARPLNALPLLAYRRKIVTSLIRHCGAPASMMDYGTP